MLKHKWRYIGLVVALWVGYIALSYNPANTAAAMERYHLSWTAIMVILASIDLPLLVCWLFGLFGWLYLRQYAASLSPDNPARRGYGILVKGVGVLALSLIIPGIITGLYSRFISSDPGAVRTWIMTYTAIAFPLAGFVLAARGSRQILAAAGLTSEPWYKSVTALVPMAVFALCYLGLIFTNPARQVSVTPGINPTYYLPDPLIILTIVLPVILTWAYGFRLSLDLEQYSHHVSPAQKPAIINLYNGTLVIVGSSILQQVIGSLGSSRATGLNLSLVLAIIYLLLLVIAAGYGLVARGAKQLQAQGGSQSQA